MKRILFLFLAAAVCGCATPAQKKCDNSNIPQLDAADNKTKILAAQELGACGNAAALDPLAGLLASSSVPVRAAAVSAIAAIGGDNALEPLSTALRQDRDPQVRLLAANGLAQYKNGRAERALIRALIFDSWQDVRSAAAVSLEHCCIATQYPVVYSGFDDWGDPAVLVEVAGSPGQFETTTAEALIFALFNDHSDVVRAVAAHALGFSVVQTAQPALVQALQTDSSARVRQEAASALGNMGDMDAQGPLLNAKANDSSQNVRDAAALALANLDERF